MTAERVAVDALEFPNAGDHLLTKDQLSSYYATTLQPYLYQGAGIVYDPDLVLESDPDGYRKMVAELAISAKLRKRSQRVVSANWSVRAKDSRLQGLCTILSDIFVKIKGFRRALHALSFNSTLRGWATSRIFGEFRDVRLAGDMMVRRWWLPVNLIDVSKERWRIHREDPVNEEAGWPRYFWAVQDVHTYKWYRLDGQDAPVGLRRADYVWARSSEDEDDLGYAHGLGRGILHKWYMLTHNWVYGMDGAESWGKGKIVISTPNSIGSATIPGSTDIAAQRTQQTIRDETASAAAKQLSRHILVLDSGQEFKVFGRPESGHESVKWMVEEIKDELDESILGVRKGENRPWDVDPELINADKHVLEDAVNDDLFETIICYNEPNLWALGYTLDDARECAWEMKRDSGFDPETLGKSIQICLAAGAPVHRNDLYGGLGLTPVDPASPDAVWAPQAGQPVSGGGVNLRSPGEGPADWPADSTGAPIENNSAPTPGGAPLVGQPGQELQVTI